MDANITKYIILVRRKDEQRNVTKEDTQTNANITVLEPGTKYTFRVVAIAIDGQSSIPSDLLTVSTSQTGIENYILHIISTFILYEFLYTPRSTTSSCKSHGRECWCVLDCTILEALIYGHCKIYCFS